MQMAVLAKAQTGSKAPGSVEIDTHQPFAAEKPGMGLIDLTSYGVRQLRKQSLSEIKMLLKDFVRSGNEQLAVTEKVKVDGNVLLSRKSPDKCQFFLLLDKPIERGQTVSLRFPTVSLYLKSGRYHGSEYELRYLIEDAFRLLSIDDLEEIRLFLEEELLSAINFLGAVKDVDAMAEKSSKPFQNACESRRRLYWVSMKLEKALGNNGIPSDKLYFGCLSNSKGEQTGDEILSPSADSLMREALADEMKKELLSSINQDKACGSSARGSWCPLFTNSFDLMVNTIVGIFKMPECANPEGMLEKLKQCLKQVLSLPVDAEHLSDLVLPRKTETDFAAVSIWDKKEHESPDTDEVAFVVCTKLEEKAESHSDDTEEKNEIILKNPDDFGKDDATINTTWYRQYQCKIAQMLVIASGSLLNAADSRKLIYNGTLFELNNWAKQECQFDEISDTEFVSAEPLLRPAESEGISAKPGSFQFFMGLVWPVLRKLGWRLDSGDSPQDLTFVAPETKVPFSKRSSQWKVRRAQARQELARQVSSIGLGSISKTAKRLVVAVVPNEDDEENANGRPQVKNVSAKVALERFQDYIRDNLDFRDRNGIVIAKKIANAVLECFSEVSPFLPDLTLADTDEAFKDNDQDMPAPPEPDAGSLLGFLTILPDILRQCDLPLQEINDALEIVQEMLLYLSLRHEKLFDKKLQPSAEVYVGNEKKIASLLMSRLRHLHSLAVGAKGKASEEKEGGDAKGVMTEIILDQDKPTLTDFLVTVLEQAVPCRASEHDVKKKFRRIHVGYPGFVCRHCLGSANEGRYFFTTIESLTTASTVFEKHVLKCPFIPAEIRARVVETRVYHADQRRQLPLGAQQAFFNRLWDRLRSAKIEGGDAGEFVLEGYAEKKAGVVESTEDLDGKVCFKEHVPLLDYLRTSYGWKNSKDVRTALSQYYNCIEFGGRVYYTSSMPKHFSPEWLLNKIAPRRYTNRKRTRMMPG